MALEFGLSYSGRDISKLIKMVLAGPRTQTCGVELGLVDLCQDDVTGCGIMSRVWGMMLQWGSTMKVSIELPIATRNRHDMAEKLLKVTSNLNKQEQQLCSSFQVWQ